MNYVLGIDAGGTFIDYFLVDEQGTYLGYKTLASPSSSDYGIITGLQELAQNLDMELKTFIKKINFIIHGTTVTTNTLLTRTGAKTALLTTEGLIDLLEMRQGSREDVYNNRVNPPLPLIDRWLRIPIRERLDYQGQVITDLDEETTRQSLLSLRNRDIESIAIVLAHSYINPAHEYKLLEMVRKTWPDVHLSLSCLVLPKPHMYKRLSTTVLDAYVAPILRDYLTGLSNQLDVLGFEGQLLIMQSNGGTLNVEESLQLPVMSILSGPAAGPNIVNIWPEALAAKDYIIMDMGGTSFDVSVIKNGSPAMKESTLMNGHLIGIPIIDIHTIGAGGGSIAWVDNGSLLHVGPDSAGANPGPACYNQGGAKPTITDANVLLGLINPDNFLGGRLKLSYKKAWEVIKNDVALPLNIEVLSAAMGIYKLVNTEMVAGIKEVTLEKGFDPRKMTLVVGGGAGPLHAAYLADQLGIANLIIPRESSVMCAAGMLCSGYRRDYYQHFFRDINGIEPKELQEIYDGLWQEALQQAGVRKGIFIEKTQIYMRYHGQHHELIIEIDKNENLSENSLRSLFHKEHLKMYGYDLEELQTGIEIVGLAIVVKGENWAYPLTQKEEPLGHRLVLKGSRLAYFAEVGDFIEVPVYDGDNMLSGYKLMGPALIEQRHSTIVVPSNFSLVCETDNFIVQKYS